MRKIILLLTCVAFVVGMALPAGARVRRPYRAFSDTSYWNTRLPSGAPIDRDSSSMISWLKSHSSEQFITLAGAGQDGSYGEPTYWARRGDPVYDVQGSGLPPEFAHLRIPKGAKPDHSGESEMAVYDRDKGYVSWLFGAHFNGNTWSASGGSIHYLASNGLDGRLKQSDEIRNRGHRGMPAPEIAIRYDEVQFGRIPHVLKFAIEDTCNHVFPMAGDEGCGGSPIPEGARLRIKPSIDLSKLKLSPAGLVVATALQRWGAVVGDKSGGAVVIKLEDTVSEGRGWLWNGVLSRDSLSAIPLTDLQVIKLGYGS